MPNPSTRHEHSGGRKHSEGDNNDDQARDAQGKFTEGGHGRSGSPQSSHAGHGDNDAHPRGAEGRFIDDDDTRGSSASSRSAEGQHGENDDRPRDAESRFTDVNR